MKRKIFNIILVLGGVLLLSGCVGSDDTTDDMMNPDAVTFEADIRPILESICQNCHMDPPINGAPMPLTSLEEVRDAIENRGLLNRINSNSNPMPPNGLLPEASRDLFQEWVDQGFIEN